MKATGPTLSVVSNGEAGDRITYCTGCDEERDEPHTWLECAATLRMARDCAIDAAVAFELERDQLRAAAEEAHRALMASPENDLHAISVLGAAMSKVSSSKADQEAP